MIGLAMINSEDDILEHTLTLHLRNVDCFYVLDGTPDNDFSEHVCRSFDKCSGYWHDRELPGLGYPDRPVDGYRQFLYEQAVADHGPDHWFLLLHADEVWTFDPRTLPGRYPQIDGFAFLLPFYFPSARDGWDDTLHPLQQLRWRLGPGWPEFRMFHGRQGVFYRRSQHFDVTPAGIRNIVQTGLEIHHYPYRADASQKQRARVTFDPDNYRHVRGKGRALWTDAMVRRRRRQGCFQELTRD